MEKVLTKSEDQRDETPCLYDLVRSQPAEDGYHWYIHTARRRLALLALCLSLGPCAGCAIRLRPLHGGQIPMLYGGET